MEDQMCDGINRVLSVVRDCNVTLRWIMLHTTELSASKITLLEAYMFDERALYWHIVIFVIDGLISIPPLLGVFSV